MNITSTPKYPGRSLSVGGQTLTIPSLTLRQLRDNYDGLTKATEGESLPATIERTLPIILLAVQRNYPEVSLDDLNDGVDIATFAPLLLAVQGASGLSPEQPGE